MKAGALVMATVFVVGGCDNEGNDLEAMVFSTYEKAEQYIQEVIAESNGELDEGNFDAIQETQIDSGLIADEESAEDEELEDA